MIQIHEFSELLASLHSTSVDAVQWEVFLDRLSKITHSSTSFLLSHQPKRRIHRVLAQGGLHTPAERQRFYVTGQQLYAESYGARDPFRDALMRCRPPGTIPGEALMNPGVYKKTDLYNDLLAPHGLEYMCIVPLCDTPERHQVLALWREGLPGPFEKEECGCLNLLQPHLQAALRVQRALESYERRALRAEAILDAAAPAVFLLNHTGQVVHYNKVAESLLLQAQVLRVCGQRLRIFPASSQQRFDHLVILAANASATGLNHPGRAMLLPRNSERSHSFQVLIAPMRIEFQGAACPAHVLVVISDPQCNVTLLDQLLKELWGCTPAEADLARHLVDHRTLEEIAVIRGVSKETARSQLKALMAKTSTRRQSELVRLLLFLPQRFDDAHFHDFHPNG